VPSQASIQDDPGGYPKPVEPCMTWGRKNTKVWFETCMTRIPGSSFLRITFPIVNTQEHSYETVEIHNGDLRFP
jgi:hypothetical protein